MSANSKRSQTNTQKKSSLTFAKTLGKCAPETNGNKLDQRPATEKKTRLTGGHAELKICDNKKKCKTRC